MVVHVLGGQTGWPETVAEDLEGNSVDYWVVALWVVLYCILGGREVRYTDGWMQTKKYMLNHIT